MKYISTRGAEASGVSSAYAIKTGLASDGGLYMPESIPTLADSEVTEMINDSYPVRAAKILSKFLTDYTYEELLQFDFGAKCGEKFRGLKIPTFEEILQKFAGRVIMNIHVKIWDLGAEDTKLSEILSLVQKYDADGHVYFMTRNDEVVRHIRKNAPTLKICLGWDKDPNPNKIVERAIALGAYKVQFYNTEVTREAIRLAHDNGILCNVYYADDTVEARRLLEMGVDTVLTNDYLSVYNATKYILEGEKK